MVEEAGVVLQLKTDVCGIVKVEFELTTFETYLFIWLPTNYNVVEKLNRWKPPLSKVSK